jgi:hypothetical protein
MSSLKVNWRCTNHSPATFKLWWEKTTTNKNHAHQKCVLISLCTDSSSRKRYSGTHFGSWPSTHVSARINKLAIVVGRFHREVLAWANSGRQFTFIYYIISLRTSGLFYCINLHEAFNRYRSIKDWFNLINFILKTHINFSSLYSSFLHVRV